MPSYLPACVSPVATSAIVLGILNTSSIVITWNQLWKKYDDAHFYVTLAKHPSTLTTRLRCMELTPTPSRRRLTNERLQLFLQRLHSSIERGLHLQLPLLVDDVEGDLGGRGRVLGGAASRRRLGVR